VSSTVGLVMPASDASGFLAEAVQAIQAQTHRSGCM
jgi:hypothetical protein